jgi:hypothetical protein
MAIPSVVEIAVGLMALSAWACIVVAWHTRHWHYRTQEDQER